jgi:hypothetical protein
MKSLARRSTNAIRALERVVALQERMLAANADVDWSRADMARAWEAAIDLKNAAKIAERLVGRLVEETERR